MSKNNKLKETGHVMVWGETGGGKTALCGRIFLGHSDVSQFKDYTRENAERIAEAFRQNCNIWYLLKPGDGSHDK